MPWSPPARGVNDSRVLARAALFASCSRRARGAGAHAVVAVDEILVLDEVHFGFGCRWRGLVVPWCTTRATPAADVAASVRPSRGGAGRRLAPPTCTAAHATSHSAPTGWMPSRRAQPAASAIPASAASPRGGGGGGTLVAGLTCVLSLTLDHRVADGVPAAELLAAVAARMADASYLEALDG